MLFDAFTATAFDSGNVAGWVVVYLAGLVSARRHRTAAGAGWAATGFGALAAAAVVQFAMTVWKGMAFALGGGDAYRRAEWALSMLAPVASLVVLAAHAWVVAALVQAWRTANLPPADPPADDRTGEPVR